MWIWNCSRMDWVTLFATFPLFMFALSFDASPTFSFLTSMSLFLSYCFTFITCPALCLIFIFSTFLSSSLALFHCSVLSIGNCQAPHYEIYFHWHQLCVCVRERECVWGVDDGKAVCVFNKHKTVMPYTNCLSIEPHMHPHKYTHKHTQTDTHKHPGFCQDCSNFQGIYVQIITF